MQVMSDANTIAKAARYAPAAASAAQAGYKFLKTLVGTDVPVEPVPSAEAPMSTLYNTRNYIRRRPATRRTSASYSTPTGPTKRKLPNRPRRRVYPRQGLRELSRRLSRVERREKNDEGILTFTDLESARLTTGTNAINMGEQIYDINNIETALAQCRFYDPSNPGTYIVSNLSSGTISKSAMISAKTYISIMSNYRTPVNLTLYTVVPITDTYIAPITAFSDGMSDQSGGFIGTTSVSAYPWQSTQFRSLYRIVATKNLILYPGQILEESFRTKEFSYDPSIVDSQNLLYQPNYGCHGYLYRIEGAPAHDSAVSNETGIAACGIDVVIKKITKVRYQAGVHVEFYVQSSGFDTFTNAPVVSIPVTAQQSAAL